MNLRVRFGVMGSVILCGVAVASAPYQKQKPQNGQLPGALLVPSASEGWQKSSTSAATLAAWTDQAISWQKNAVCFVKVAYAGDGKGTSEDEIFISGPNKFRLQFPYMTVLKSKQSPPEPTLVKRELTCNGNKAALWEGGKGVLTNVSVEKFPFSAKTTPLKWATDFPFQLFYALRPGVKPMSALVAAAQSAHSGVITRVEEKQFPFQGHIAHQFRLTIVQQNGGSVPVPKIQITIDGTRRLPVTILTTGQLPGRPPVQLTWRATWGTFKAGKMKESYFTLPSATKSISK